MCRQGKIAAALSNRTGGTRYGRQVPDLRGGEGSGQGRRYFGGSCLYEYAHRCSSANGVRRA